ncbi:MAG: M23 family metallopeptidase [Oscillospiraceae bacterium]|jgi:murein DD-endopeptidase MepM/ murein hydrolase activator NlpD|nr:M23 family metallopeptidase [Oscillospiraceae bacterium]
MSIKSDCVLYSVIREEHMVHNDFFLRYLELDGETPPSALVFACLTGGRELLRVCYGPEEIAARLAYAQEELPRYRDSSLGRILGLDRRPERAFLHEHFSFFASQAADELRVEADWGGKKEELTISVVPYESPNRWRFPLAGTVLVTDTYPSVNSHRWCRNSEFAFDAGAFDETLTRPVIGGSPVFAACGGVVEEAFDGLDDTDDGTDLAQIEAQYGEHARIDGNHVLIRHEDGERSLYAHLQKGSVSVAAGESVQAGRQIGRVGSSGSSWVPHLHFHVMLGGIEGPGVPVRFENLTTILGEPCMLEDTVNLVRAEEILP